MIETTEELINNLRYRQTDETYGEYIKRLEEIINRWHKSHTTMCYNLKELVKKWDDRADNIVGYEGSMNSLTSNDMSALVIQCRDEMKHAMESEDYLHYIKE